MRHVVSLALAVCIGLGVADAHAQAAADFPATGSISDVTTGVEQTRPFWSGSGKRRPFLAATLGVGIVFGDARLQAGYGKPHFSWVGAEGGARVGLGSERFYAGFRARHPGINFRVGVRYEAAVQQGFLPPQESYERVDLETECCGLSRYLAPEAEVTATVPIPYGSIIGVVTGMAVALTPSDFYVWEQSLRTVIAPPWVWRARLGYLAHIGWAGSMKLGAAAEIIHIPRREMVVVRAGPLVSVGLTHHLEVNGGLMIVAASRDSIGLPAADVGQLALIYKWALGDRWPEFP